MSATIDFTSTELDLMDELYFIKHWDELLEATEWAPATLRDTLWGLMQRGMVRTASQQDGVAPHLPQSPQELKDCYFLATKEGLLALHT